MSGTYLESCNCNVICPCRTVAGEKGGRSTHGICFGALSWRIEEGNAADVDLAGLSVVIADRYDDDEQGSPWTFRIYLDERADPEQREALSDIYLGHAGGTPLKQFPWAWKDSSLAGVHAVPIEIDHTPGRGWFRVADRVTVRIRRPAAETAPVTCVIPGHHQAGREVHAEELLVADAPLEFELTDVCGYESRFAYSSEDE
jgi:hypothetical protein